MSESEGLELNGGRLQDFTIDQLAGALALSLGAVGTLLLVIWQSRCACRCRLGLSDKCYIFDCSREPPPLKEDDEEEQGQVAQANQAKREKVEIKLSDEEITEGTFPSPVPSEPLIRPGEPEPEPEILK